MSPSLRVGCTNEKCRRGSRGTATCCARVRWSVGTDARVGACVGSNVEEAHAREIVGTIFLAERRTAVATPRTDAMTPLVWRVKRWHGCARRVATAARVYAHIR
jgi:hypothetical protein